MAPRPDAGAADGAGAAAVDLAEYLVEHGMPFRQAHALVGALVRDSLERHVPLSELVEATPSSVTPALRFSSQGGGHRRTTPGGAGPKAVAEQMARFVAVRRRPDAGRPLGRDGRPGVNAPAPLERFALARDPLDVAPWLLGKC